MPKNCKNCKDCGFSNGVHIRDCPSTPRYSPQCSSRFDHQNYEYSHARNTGSRPWGPECPVHGPTARAAAEATPYKVELKPPEPSPQPDEYISPHSLDTSHEQPTSIPVYDYTEDENGMIQACLTGYRTVIGAHQEWVNARERYATDPEQHPLDTVLMHVTETNPPPGPPIPVHKPAAEPEKPPLHRRGVGLSVLCWSVFTGMYIPYGEHGHDQLSLFIVVAVLWMTATWALRRVR